MDKADDEWQIKSIVFNALFSLVIHQLKQNINYEAID